MKKFEWIDIKFNHQKSLSSQQAIKNSVNQVNKQYRISLITLIFAISFKSLFTHTHTHTYTHTHTAKSFRFLCIFTILTTTLIWFFLSCFLFSSLFLSMMSMLFRRNRVMQNHDEWRSCRHWAHWKLFILMKLMSLIFSIDTRICAMIFISIIRRKCDDYLDITKW